MRRFFWEVYMDSFFPNVKFRWIGHVRYINILTWLRGFRVKIVNFLSFFCLSIPKRDLDTKKTTPNIEVWPESLGAMLEYWYIERGLLPRYIWGNDEREKVRPLSFCSICAILNHPEEKKLLFLFSSFRNGVFGFWTITTNELL